MTVNKSQIIFQENTKDSMPKTKQKMEGFDEKYDNIVDYIAKITHEIWEEKGIGVIYDTYAEGITIESGASTIRGINAVVGGTLETLHAFPDRRLVNEDVIWSKEQNTKFYTSHRIASTATNLGNSAFGAATGRKIFFRTIADCLVSANKIEEEWLVRDNLHIIQQLGFDAIELAKKSGKYHKKNLPTVTTFPENRMGQFVPDKFEGQPSDSATLVQRLFQNVWNGRYFNEVANHYHPTATVHSICDQDYRGNAQIQGFLANLFASLPTAAVQIERISSNISDSEDHVAVRWRINGLHQGKGFFGEASNKVIDILGISHFVVTDGKIKTQWDVFDAFDVLCQIHADSPQYQKTLPKPLVIHDRNKSLIAQLIADSNKAISKKEGFETVLSKYFTSDISWNGSKPFDELRGTDRLFSQFWKPLIHAFPDLEDQPYILMAGQFQEKDWVSITGNYVGTFENEWLGIKPTQQVTFIRYGIFYELKDGKIQTAYCILDMLDVIRQVGINLFPNRAVEITIPGPATGDGILTYPTELTEGQKSLQLTEDMIKGLMKFNGKDLETMEMHLFWSPNMMWYGPAGTGSTRGLKGFQEYHQKPFLKGFPDRKGGHHKARFGDGHYSCSTGWPSIYATHGGDDWMGILATDRKITMRVMDWWHREGDMLNENWVFIDKIDLLLQLDIDVFELVRQKSR